MLEELLLTLLQAVIVAAVPVLTTFAVKFLQAKSAQLGSQTENEKARMYLAEITGAITTAVTATSQTYVDALKNTGTFSPEAQLEALEKAKQTAISILSPAAVEFIENVYGDISSFIEAKIEELVHSQKAATPIMLGTIAETTDTDAIVAAVVEKLTAEITAQTNLSK